MLEIHGMLHGGIFDKEQYKKEKLERELQDLKDKIEEEQIDRELRKVYGKDCPDRF